MIFTLFKEIVFKVDYPEALIEAYCIQSDFYAKYDLKRPRNDKSYERLGSIGARTTRTTLDECIKIIERNSDFPLFNMTLDRFLKEPLEIKSPLISRLGLIAKELDDVPGIGFSKATKILHTRFPAIIPIIDNALQKKYKTLRRDWRDEDWGTLFKDYYDNLQVEETWNNLCEIDRSLSFLGLTKIRIFDILWWSYLKSEKLRKRESINWRTIAQVAPPRALR